jgi:hypothetical protein
MAYCCRQDMAVDYGMYHGNNHDVGNDVDVDNDVDVGNDVDLIMMLI